MLRDEASTPSIRKQTPWPCGIYSFGKAEKSGTDYFNPTLMRRDDGLWLIVRRSQWRAHHQFGINDLMVFKLENNCPAFGFPIRVDKRYPDEQVEDPRAFYHKGRAYVSACDFIWNRQHWSGAHQIVTEVDRAWGTTWRFDPEVGKNGATLGLNRGNEKNWTYISSHDGLYLCYQAAPHVLIPMTDDFRVDQSKDMQATITAWDHHVWDFGEIRGGAPPVLVDGLYYDFFHSSTPWKDKKRKYHMGCLCFDPKPPFRVVKITIMPLLSGSQDDPWSEGKPLVVFPGGVDYRDGKFLVVFGVNDLKCGWIEIPKTELDDQLIEL